MTDLKLACGRGVLAARARSNSIEWLEVPQLVGSVQRTGTKVRNRSISQVRPARVRIGSRPAQIWPSGPGRI